MNDMDPSLLSFVQTRVTSFIKWDLMRFLHENPHTLDSAANIARYTGRNISDIRPDPGNPDTVYVATEGAGIWTLQLDP